MAVDCDPRVRIGVGVAAIRQPMPPMQRIMLTHGRDADLGRRQRHGLYRAASTRSALDVPHLRERILSAPRYVSMLCRIRKVPLLAGFARQPPKQPVDKMLKRVLHIVATFPLNSSPGTTGRPGRSTGPGILDLLGDVRTAPRGYLGYAHLVQVDA